MSDYQPIDCSLHDELEVLCLHRSKVSVRLRDGAPIEGVAADWISDRRKAEYLLLNCSSGQKRVRLDRIVAIETQTAGGSTRTLRF